MAQLGVVGAKGAFWEILFKMGAVFIRLSSGQHLVEVLGRNPFR